LKVARGLVVRDPEVLERRLLIREVMCHFQTRFDPRRYPQEWEHLHTLAADGLLRLEAKDGLAVLEVSREGRWLLRSIAAVFDPQQRVGGREGTGFFDTKRRGRRTIRACWQPVRGPSAVSVL
jgi:oxygen-independent coproporphyrinogen-3 oxidase